MKKLQITYFLLLTSLLTHAQNFNWEDLNDTRNRLSGKLTGVIYYMTAGENSQYFYHDHWPEGTVLLTDGDLYEGLRLRYHAYSDELVVYNPALKQLFIVDKEKVTSFTVLLPQGEQTFVKLYFNGLIPENRYFERLYNGDLQLLAYRSIDEQKTGLYRDSGGRLRDDILKLNTAYYVYDSDTGFKRVQLRRRSILNLFSDKKKEVRRIFRKNNFYRMTEKEMVQSFNLLEQAGIF